MDTNGWGRTHAAGTVVGRAYAHKRDALGDVIQMLKASHAVVTRPRLVPEAGHLTSFVSSLTLGCCKIVRELRWILPAWTSEVVDTAQPIIMLHVTIIQLDSSGDACRMT